LILNNNWAKALSVNSSNPGKIYQAYDKYMEREVALKVEKVDKHKKILKFEYEILRNLQGITILT
jgi:predicted Ser/Thr protein kinase